MAYDAALADRVRQALAGEKGVTEKAMFGGIAFLVGGNMAIGVATEDLMVRVGPEAHEASLARPHTRPMDFTGRPMRGYVFVASVGTRTSGEVRAWTERALAFARTLPPKAKSAPARKKQAARRPR